MKPIKRLIGAASVALFVSVATAAPMATDAMAHKLLAQMASAFQNRSFEGSLVYKRGEDMVSLKVHHDIVAGEAVERIERLNSSPIQIMRRGNWLLGMYPGKEMLRMGHSVPQATMPPLNQRLQHVTQHYTLRVLPEDRVASRAAIPVRLEASDEFRFDRVFWCDVETGLMLRAQTLGTNDEVLEQFEFLDVRLTEPQDDATVVVDAQGMDVYRHALIPGEAPNAAMFEGLTPGFMLISESRDEDARTLLVTDGISLVSVFVEPATQERQTVRATQGPTQALSRTLPVNDTFFKVTLVGEVPQATLSDLLSRLNAEVLDVDA